MGEDRSKKRLLAWSVLSGVCTGVVSNLGRGASGRDPAGTQGVSRLMEERKRRYLEAMGIPVWVERQRKRPVAGDPASQPAPVAQMGWDALAAVVKGCTACELHRSRTQTVFGVGNRQAKWMVIGEAPGADEDRQGEPFVGRAGRLLNAMLQAVGLQREQVYIANILKCRPPNNRDPRPEEIACCEPFLWRQIQLIGPQVILAVGRVAAQSLLKTTTPIGRLRGRPYRLAELGIPVVVTYHPAYLLRSPQQKRRAWDDLRLARAVLEETM